MKTAARRVPRALSLLVVLAGGVALVWGAATLQRIFIEERDSAKASITVRQRAIEQYALVALERKLRAEAADARPRIDAALADPLLEEQGLLMVDDGRQLLPRLTRYLDGSDTPATRLYGELRAGTATGEGLWGERLALLDALKRGLASSDGARITDSVRDFLNHQSRFVVPVTHDLPYRLCFIESFVEGTTPDRDLLHALLRDGLRGTQGRRLVGLQSLLLSNRERFSRPDFEFLVDMLSTLSRQARVVHDDFDARVASETDKPVVVPIPLKNPALLWTGAWYAVPLEAAGLYGIAVNVQQKLSEITGEMRQGGLLGSADSLFLGSPLGDLVAVADVPVRVRAQAFAAEAAEIDRRYALKTATGIMLVALLAGVAALIALLYWRERRLLEAKAGFVATVSHELRTPIASLRLMGETLERRLEGVETARDFPSRIVGEADRLSFLVENILSFNRLDKANVKTNLQSVTVAELLESASGSAQAFTKTPLNLRITVGAALTVRADAELVKLLFSNLINNSCKYNARDPVDVEVAAAADSDRLVVRYTDNGTGIPKDDWEAVFTEFVRSRSSRTTSGFGLGLALCRRIMDLHDGTIVVADSSDAGTTFEMAFVAPAGGAS